MPSTDIADISCYGELFGPDALARQLCEKVVGMSDEDMITKHRPKAIVEHGVNGQDKPRPGTKINSSKVWQQQTRSAGGAKQPPVSPPLPRADLLREMGQTQQPAAMYGMEEAKQFCNSYSGGQQYYGMMISRQPPQDTENHSQRELPQSMIWQTPGRMLPQQGAQVHLQEGDLMMQQGAAQWLAPQSNNLFEHAQAQAVQQAQAAQQCGMLHQTSGSQQQGDILPAKLALINGSQLAAILDTENPTLLSHWGQNARCDARGNMVLREENSIPPGLHDQQHHDGLHHENEDFSDRRSHNQQIRVGRNREVESRRCSCSFIFIGFDPVQHHDFELVPRLIGRGGAHMRDIAEVCRGKVRIRGRGSGYKEVRKGRRPPTEADVPLQIALSCEERASLEQGKARLLAFLEHLSGHFQRYCRKQGLPVPPALYVLVGDE